MSRHRVIYWWSVQFGEGFKAQKQKLRLSLKGEKGNRESDLLRDERKQIGGEIARPSFRAEGMFPETPSLGNVLRGSITIEGPPVAIDWVALKGDGAVWTSERLGLVNGAKDFVFLIESEESWGPNETKKAIEADKRLKEENPEEWAQKVRERNELIKSATGIVLPDPVIPKRVSTALTTAPDSLSAAALTAYRTQGLTDAQILEREAKKGRLLPGQEGRPIVSSIPNRGSDFEGYSFQSAPVVKLADEDQTEEV